MHVGHLFSDDFDENPLSSFAVELAIKNLLPWAEIELPFCNSDYDFSPHHLTLQMGIGIILPDIMAILFNRLVGSKLLKPDLEIMMQTLFIIIDENRGSDMHGIDEHQTFLDATLFEACFNLGSNIDQGSSG